MPSLPQLGMRLQVVILFGLVFGPGFGPSFGLVFGPGFGPGFGPSFGPLCADPRGDSELQGYFNRFDQNQDRRISVAEYQAKLSYAFFQLDRNQNQVLEVSEQPGNRPKRLTLSEHHQRLARQFARQDRNRDGYLNLQELAAPPR